MTTVPPRPNNRFMIFTPMWTKFIVGVSIGFLLPMWVLLIAAQIILPSLAVSAIWYFVLARTGQSSVMAGAYSASVIALFLALPAIIG